MRLRTVSELSEGRKPQQRPVRQQCCCGRQAVALVASAPAPAKAAPAPAKAATPAAPVPQHPRLHANWLPCVWHCHLAEDEEKPNEVDESINDLQVGRWHLPFGNRRALRMSGCGPQNRRARTQQRRCRSSLTFPLRWQTRSVCTPPPCTPPTGARPANGQGQRPQGSISRVCFKRGAGANGGQQRGARARLHKVILRGGR